jgi:hypothetical protein
LRINYKNLRICDLRAGTLKKFADLRFEDFEKNLRLPASANILTISAIGQNLRSTSGQAEFITQRFC